MSRHITTATASAALVASGFGLYAGNLTYFAACLASSVVLFWVAAGLRRVKV